MVIISIENQKTPHGMPIEISLQINISPIPLNILKPL